ncbi:hypothetical protein NEA10_19980 [Phormidium yuhuli AB48]|uniref:Uncharacterized protein n=1 Tax=Phormidium yuhuli AB48 TaxID=2940671 RepID=A0ABY5AS73_9CYAN|nr:hypothetical protein [Phormidium yuhuli]USR91074.1 hypothetical protein NEA10_19980 [Phormidium yuhuli AB48]
MTPEQRLAAFWEIWETNPDNILETSGAIQGLPTLRESLVACQNQSDADVAAEIKKWCRSYPKLTQKLMDKVGERKLRGANNDGPQTDDRAVVNQYPEITQILRNRVPRMGTKEGKS